MKTDAKLYCDQGTVNSEFRKPDNATGDRITIVTCVKAFWRGAQCFGDKEQPEEAVEDYEKKNNTLDG